MKIVLTILLIIAVLSVGCQPDQVISQLEVGRDKLLGAGLAIEAVEHLKQAEQEEVNKVEPRALLLIAYSHALHENMAKVHHVESDYQRERAKRISELSEYEMKKIVQILNERHRVQKAGIQILIDKGAPVVPLLVDNLVKGRNKNAHGDFIQILTEIGSKGTDQLLASVAAVETPLAVKIQLVRIIGNSGDSSATDRLESLHKSSDDAGLKMELSTALYLLGNETYQENIIAGLSDSNVTVRQAAAKSMISLNQPPTDMMIKALQDSDDTVRHDIANALQKHHDASAVDSLVALLTSNSSSITKQTVVNTLNLYAEKGLATGLAERLIPLLMSPEVVNHEDRIRMVQLLKKPALLKQIEEADKYENLPSKLYDYFDTQESNDMVKEELNALLHLIPE